MIRAIVLLTILISPAAMIQAEDVDVAVLPLPLGRVEYQVLQAPDTAPRIFAIRVDTPPVSYGDFQTVEVIGDAGVVSVEALVEIDHASGTVPFGIVDPETALLNRYNVGSDGKVWTASTTVAPLPFATSTYRGRWWNYDGTATRYRMTVTAKDEAGHESAVAFDWNNPCQVPRFGEWAADESCRVFATDGVEEGNVTVANATLMLDTPFGYNPGHVFMLRSGGTVLVAPHASIDKAYVWQVDRDQDGRPATATQYLAVDPPPHSNRRSSLRPETDCNDSFKDQWQWVDGLVNDMDHDGWGAGPVKKGCVGEPKQIQGRTYFNPMGPLPFYNLLLASDAIGMGDCHDLITAIYQTGGGGIDRDHDGWIFQPTVECPVCVGKETIINSRSYYDDAQGKPVWLRGSQIIGYSDADDGNPGVH